MKLKFKYIYIGLAAIIVVCLMAFTGKEQQTVEISNKQKIKFSHSLHKDLAECIQCHPAVEKSKDLKDRMMPSHQECSTCHDVEKQDECNKCHVNDTYEALDQKVNDNIIFSHEFHLSKQSLKCETCHKGITDVDYAEDAAQPSPKMEDCYTCHNDSKIAPNSCESCHIKTANLKPQSHMAVNFTRNHKFDAEDVNANCIMCHNNGNNSCETCHSADKVSGMINSNNFADSHSPNNFIDGTRQQKITRVHDLNYKFTHGIDARSKKLNCQSCHETETFCVTCHQNENQSGLGGIVPASHLKPNFFTYGYGSGGGLHADLARRDIESCVACHDIQGADPTCITCHLDNDGIKGTNARTHPAGFMKHEHGDWHHDSGSVCYNCHAGSPKGIPGQGFCGYCHGGK